MSCRTMALGVRNWDDKADKEELWNLLSLNVKIIILITFTNQA